MHELIASITDLLGKASQPDLPGGTQVIVVQEPEPENTLSPLTHAGDDINRFRQIVALADQPNPHAEYSNEPNEQYASIEAVTTHAGGGLNGPNTGERSAGVHGNARRQACCRGGLLTFVFPPRRTASGIAVPNGCCDGPAKQGYWTIIVGVCIGHLAN